MSPDPARVRVVGSGAPPPDEPGAEEEYLEEARPAKGAPWIVAIAVFALFVIALFFAVFFFVKYHHLSSRNAEQGNVVRVSTDFLDALTNFNANTIDSDFAKLQGYATGNFQGQALQFFSSDVRQALAKVQATSRGQIRSIYVETLSGNGASVYADVDQTIANLNFSKPEEDELRIVLTLQKLSGGWKIADVTVLQGPSVPSAGS